MAIFPINGFLGTGATFEADLNLIVQVVIGVGSSGETKTLRGSRNLSDDGVAFESGDDRAGDVAFVPTASEGSAP